MRSRFDAALLAARIAQAPPELPRELVERVYTARLLGAEPELVLHGGGNCSVKGGATELDGARVDVLWVKGSGWDLASIEARGFPACRLAPLLRLAALESLSDEDMVRGLRSQLLDPSSPTPSVEALLHALLPARFVDHTHADAVLALVDQPDSEARVRALWGDAAVFVPYVMPGFDLARAVRERLPLPETARLMILDKHGIFTWGETAVESYERMIRAVSEAEAVLEREGARSQPPEPPVTERGGVHEVRTRGLLTTLTEERPSLPPPPALEGVLTREVERLQVALRGAFARRGLRGVVEWRHERALVLLATHPRAEELTRLGPATPDHVLRVRPSALVLPGPEISDEGLGAALDVWAEDYHQWFVRGARARGRTPRELDGLPRVVLVPGSGALAVGTTLAEARVVGDVAVHDAEVLLAAERLGRYRPVSEVELWDVEYWSLEQAKLAIGEKPRAALSQRVALVTGAAGGIGRAVAARLLGLGASVLLVDRREVELEATTQALAQRHGLAVASAVAELTDEASAAAAVRAAVARFGGIDLLVSNAGAAPSGLLHQPEGDAALAASFALNFGAHQRMARLVTEVLLAQSTGGALLFNASKSAFNQGPEFGPYAVPKAALIALMKQYAVDLGRHGIRSAAVNADRVRTELFGGGVLEARARARGLTPEAYFRDNLLRRETTVDDVADAFAWLARAEASTGLVVTVDGGNAAAFPR